MGARLTISDRLGTTAFATDPTPHLRLVSADLCRACVLRPCIRVCPAEVYSWEAGPEPKLRIRYENCLETGACRIACHVMGNQALVWEYPPGGRGVSFRLG